MNEFKPTFRYVPSYEMGFCDTNNYLICTLPCGYEDRVIVYDDEEKDGKEIKKIADKAKSHFESCIPEQCTSIQERADFLAGLKKAYEEAESKMKGTSE